MMVQMYRLLTGEGDKEKVNYSRKDCVMMILAMEAGLDIPEVLFEVGQSLEKFCDLLSERNSVSTTEDNTHFFGIQIPFFM